MNHVLGKGGKTASRGVSNRSQRPASETEAGSSTFVPVDGVLYWVPHLTEVWTVARYSAARGCYMLEGALETATDDGDGGKAPDTIVDLDDSSLKKIATARQDVSEVFREAVEKKQFNNLIFPVTDINNLEGPNNICDLSHVSEASVLHSLRQRYLRDAIYSNVGRIVIALNPFANIKGLYGSAQAAKYGASGSNPYRLAPHVYQVAAAAFKRLAEFRTAQAAIITGESGSGKTESTKLILEYLASVGSKPLSNEGNSFSRVPTGRSDLKLVSRKTLRLTASRGDIRTDTKGASIEDRILRVNPLLEAFGNATTSRNPNSSRFGKWIEMYFSPTNVLVGASITSYLLELPRVTRHITGERGYHVFYQFLLALETELASVAPNYNLQGGIAGLSAYRYLIAAEVNATGAQNIKSPRGGRCGVDDAAGFSELRSALCSLQFEPSEQDGLFSVVATLLHIGNITFEVQKRSAGAEGAAITLETYPHLENAARLLQIDLQALQESFEYRQVVTANESIQVPLQPAEAETARDGFAKLVYGCLFDWILYRANASLHPPDGVLGFSGSAHILSNDGDHTESGGSGYVGILDIAGFESFFVNGFEQLCINLTNEKLQHQFNEDIFKSELDDYAQEGLKVVDITFSDNTDVLELIEAKDGIMGLLDEELFVPRGSDTGFLNKLLKAKEKHPRMLQSKIRGNAQFTIKHFAGPVIYTVTGWLEKNQYAPPRSALTALHTACNPVVQDMLSLADTKVCVDGTGGKRGTRTTVGSHFREELNRLVTKIKSTEVHYVRCIKPNQTLQPRQFDAVEVLRQLCYSGAMEAIQIRKAGFPIRLLISDFLTAYGILYGRRLATLPITENPAEAAHTLIEHINQSFGISSKDIVVGHTRVFLTDSVQEALNQFRNLALGEPATRIQAAYRGYRVRKYTKIAFELNRRLRPLLGAGAASLRQNGLFLYPVAILTGVETGEGLSNYVDGAGATLEACAKLPSVFQPATLEKATEIFDRMRREANVVESAERLLNEESLNVAKMMSVQEKAKKYKLENPAFDRLQWRMNCVQYEGDLTTIAEELAQASEKNGEAIQSTVDAGATYLSTNELADYMTKPLRKAMARLQATQSAIQATPEEEVQDSKPSDYGEPQNGQDQSQWDEGGLGLPSNRVVTFYGDANEESNKLQVWESRVYSVDEENVIEQRSASKSYGEEESSVSSSSDSDHSTEWDWSSSDEDVTRAPSVADDGEDGATRVLPKSAGKFMRELRAAVAVLDAERLDLLIQGYQDAGLESRHCREFLLAKEVRANLDIPEWVVGEIKEGVVSVVWGTNDRNDVSRLTNLLKHAYQLGISGPDIEAGEKALRGLRASPLQPSQHPSYDDKTVDVGKFNVVVSAFDITKYPGLRIYQKRREGFFSHFFGAKLPPADVFCSHTYDRLVAPLTADDSKEFRKMAQMLFRVDSCLGLLHLRQSYRLIQSYMGDRPHLAPECLADDIVALGLKYSFVRDEVYLQVVKQLTRNPKPQSETRGWSLMLYLCQNFAPSADLQPYIRYFLFQRTTAIGDFRGGIFDEVGEIAKQALKEFDKSVTRRVVWTKPRRPDAPQPEDVDSSVAARSVSETDAEWNADIMIYLLDDSRQKIAIGYDTTVGDVVTEICRRFNMDVTGWSIMELREVDNSTLELAFFVLNLLGVDLLSQKVIQSALYALWGFPQFRVIPDNERVWNIWDPVLQDFPKMAFRRRLISTSELLYPHPYHAHLTYKQLLWEFKRYPVPESMPVLAAVIARILVAEKWNPHTSAGAGVTRAPNQVTAYESNRRGPAYAFGFPNGPDVTRAAVRALAITYFMLRSSGYIPLIYITEQPQFQTHWEVLVQRVYQTLDIDEHQLLAINSVLTEMRQLKAFGAFCWLVIEPNGRAFNTLTENSQLCAAYANTDISNAPGALCKCFNNLMKASRQTFHPQKTPSPQSLDDVTIPEDPNTVLHPMVITPSDLQQLRYDVEVEALQQQEMSTHPTPSETPLGGSDAGEGGSQAPSSTSSRFTWHWKIWGPRAAKKGKRSTDRRFTSSRFFRKLLFQNHEHDFDGVFAAGEEAEGKEVHQPLWMALNSDGLKFFPAVSFGKSNWDVQQPLTLPFSQVFACECLWTFHPFTKTWVCSGLLFCVDLRNSSAPSPAFGSGHGGSSGEMMGHRPQWSLIAIVPLSVGRRVIERAPDFGGVELRRRAGLPAKREKEALIPSLHFYGHAETTFMDVKDTEEQAGVATGETAEGLAENSVYYCEDDTQEALEPNGDDPYGPEIEAGDLEDAGDDEVKESWIPENGDEAAQAEE